MSLIKKIRKEVLNLSRSDFELKTNFSQHTLRHIEFNQIIPSDKLKNELITAFKSLDIEISEDLKSYNNLNNTSNLDIECKIDNRIDMHNRFMKKQYPNVFSLRLQDDRLGNVFKENSILYGEKKYENYDKYLSEYCIVVLKKPRKIRQKIVLVRKLKSIDNKFNKIVLEKLKGESSDLRIEKNKVNFICPIFCVRYYNDYQS